MARVGQLHISRDIGRGGVGRGDERRGEDRVRMLETGI